MQTQGSVCQNAPSTVSARQEAHQGPSVMKTQGSVCQDALSTVSARQEAQQGLSVIWNLGSVDYAQIMMTVTDSKFV